MPKVVNIIGQKFGRLLVIKEFSERTPNGHKKYVCNCDCGNTHITSGESIRKGSSKSCGCLRREYKSSNYNENRKQQILKDLYHSTVVKRCKSKGWVDFLDFSLFENIVQSNCKYCGVEPISKIEDRSNKNNGYLMVNGVDRIDSDLGYTRENSVPCCKICNSAKNNMSVNDFKEWVRKVYNHLF